MKRNATKLPTLEVHRFQCSNCGQMFESSNRGQLGSVRAGRNVYCNQECYTAMTVRLARSRPGKHVCGPCPTCGHEFLARTKTRRFCSLKCYVDSGEAAARLRPFNEARAKDWICRCCGKEAPRKRQFCDDFCRRRFFAERFDRFIANPEDIALPQNFDEFLDQDELPCLVAGCDWIGARLGQHVNLYHGIDQAKFREMVGFNVRTALCGVADRKQRSATMRRLIEAGVIIPGSYPLQECSKKERGPLRLEGREHWQKAMVIAQIPQKLADGALAYVRSEEGRKKASERMRQTMAEAPKITLICQECEKPYETLKMFERRGKYCGQYCANAAARKRRPPPVPIPLITLICQECGGPYQVLKTFEGRSKFCGVPCRNAATHKRLKASKKLKQETTNECGQI